MMIDCKKISGDIRGEIEKKVRLSKKEVRLAIIKASHNDATADASMEAFLKQKRACGREVGIDVREYDVSERLESQHMLEKRVSEIACIKENDAVIIQLPLPDIIKPDGTRVPANTQAVLNSVPPKKDADVLHAESCGRYEAGSESALVPPAMGAVEAILKRYANDVLDELDKKTIVAVGQGFVIGKQVNRWAVRYGAASFSGLRDGSDVGYFTRAADIIVSGVGKAGLITPDMIKSGAILFDFGFSKKDGILRGDVDPLVAQKARLLTPVPGGMGPLAVTMLFWNVARIREVCGTG